MRLLDHPGTPPVWRARLTSSSLEREFVWFPTPTSTPAFGFNPHLHPCLWVHVPASAAGVRGHFRGLWFQGQVLCFFFVGQPSAFSGLWLSGHFCFPSLPPHSTSRLLSYLGGVVKLSETNWPFHKNHADTIKHSQLKRDFLTMSCCKIPHSFYIVVWKSRLQWGKIRNQPCSQQCKYSSGNPGRIWPSFLR